MGLKPPFCQLKNLDRISLAKFGSRSFPREFRTEDHTWVMRMWCLKLQLLAFFVGGRFYGNHMNLNFSPENEELLEVEDDLKIPGK